MPFLSGFEFQGKNLVHLISRSPLKTLLFLASVCLLVVPSSTAELRLDSESLRNAVVFIYQSDDLGHVDGTKPIGTGFFVNIPMQDPSKAWVVLVTARHIVDPDWLKGCALNNEPKRIFLRLNLKNYDHDKNVPGTEFLPVDLTTKGRFGLTRQYSVSSDPEIDAAVVRLDPQSLSEQRYDFNRVSISMFATDTEMSKLLAGDPVLSVGLVPYAEGQKRNYPVFKFGNFSNKLDEPFLTGCEGGYLSITPEKVWFISMNLSAGASGSPIFYTPPSEVRPELFRPILIGVQSSSIPGADVAAITPASFVFQIIKEMQLPDADMRNDPHLSIPKPDRTSPAPQLSFPAGRHPTGPTTPLQQNPPALGSHN